MTDPTQHDQDDLTGEAGEQLVERTDNGWHDGDPEQQPPQDPAWRPDSGQQPA